MKLQISTLDKGTEIDKEVSLVEADGEIGHFGVLNRHLPLITKLKQQATLRYQSKPSNPFKQIRLSEGFLEVCEEKGQTIIKVIASSLVKE